jgi:hypothetical protein
MPASQAPWIADPLAFCQSSIAAKRHHPRTAAAAGRLRPEFAGSHHPKDVHLPDRKGFSGELEML